MYRLDKNAGSKSGPAADTKKDRSLGHFHTEAAAAASEDAADGYQTPSLVAAGADVRDVVILTALARLVVAFLYSRVPAVIKRTGSRKRALLTLATLDVLAWLPLIGVLLFVRPITPLWLIACWLASLVPGTLSLPARDSWLADTIPSKIMGHYLGKRSVISASVYLGMFYVTGYVLDLFTGDPLIGFAVVFSMALVATVVKLVAYGRIRDMARPKKEIDFSFREFMQETRRESLGRFIIYLSFLNVAVYLCAPLFAVYMVEVLQFSYLTFAVVFSADFIARAISASFWGKYADSVGNMAVLGKICYLIPFVPMLWLFSSNVFYLISIQLISGTIWAGFEVCSQSLVFQSASPEKRAGYIVHQRSLTAVGQAAGALAGAYLLDLIFPVLGSRIFGLFLLSGALRLVITAVMLPGIRPSARTFRAYPVDVYQAATAATGAGAIMSRGLFYRPEDWDEYVRRPQMFIGAKESERPVTRGLYHRKHQWARYMGQHAAERFMPPAATNPALSQGLFSKPKPEPSMTLEVPTLAPLAQGLYRRRQDWAKATGRPAAERFMPAAESAPVLSRGLYHNPEKARVTVPQEENKFPVAHGLYQSRNQWAKVVAAQSSAQAFSPKVEAKPVPARGLYHEPRRWSEYQASTRVKAVEKPDLKIASRQQVARDWARQAFSYA